SDRLWACAGARLGVAVDGHRLRNVGKIGAQRDGRFIAVETEDDGMGTGDQIHLRDRIAEVPAHVGCVCGIANATAVGCGIATESDCVDAWIEPVFKPFQAWPTGAPWATGRSLRAPQPAKPSPSHFAISSMQIRCGWERA